MFHRNAHTLSVRPVGCLDWTPARLKGMAISVPTTQRVRILPGQTALMQMPRAAHLCARRPGVGGPHPCAEAVREQAQDQGGPDDRGVGGLWHPICGVALSAECWPGSKGNDRNAEVARGDTRLPAALREELAHAWEEGLGYAR